MILKSAFLNSVIERNVTLFDNKGDDANIRVALSTTKYMLPDSKEVRKEDLLIINQDIPVCIAELYVEMPPLPGSSELFEHSVAESIKEAMKVVHIDSKHKSIYIGDDPSDMSSSIISFEEIKNNEYEMNFFERWDEQKKLILEFNVLKYDINKDNFEPLFSIKGLWSDFRWINIHVDYKGSIQILEDGAV